MSAESKITSMFNNMDDEDSYTSEMKFRNFKLNWTIGAFEFACKHMKLLESPVFPSTNTEKLKWYLRFEPVELKPENNEQFKITLKNTENADRYIECHFSILNSAGKGARFYCNLKKLSRDVYWTETGSELYKCLFHDKDLSKNVNVICTVSVFDSVKDTIEKPLNTARESEDLQKQIETFFDDQLLRDVTFKVKGKKFTAHKVILSLRSPVFATMFKSGIKNEEVTSIVQVPEIKSTIFEKMLCFIYTNKIENLEESSVDLFYAADKYQLETLKAMCIDSLYKNLSLDSVLKTLEFADDLSMSDLKDKALEFLIENIDELNGTVKFKKLTGSRPHLLKEMIKPPKTIGSKKKDNVEQSKRSIFVFRA